MVLMRTAQIKCPHCAKHTRVCDIVYPEDAATFRVNVICHNRQCRSAFTVLLPEWESKALAS